MKKRRIISAILSLLMAGTMCVGLTGCGVNNSKKDNMLLWYTFGDRPTDIDAVLAKANEIIEPAIGMKLDMQFIDSASYGEKMKLKMASNEAFDLCFTGYNNNYQMAANMGGLYDITELIEEVGMKEAVSESMIEAAKIKGRVYGIPNEQVVSNPQCLLIDKSLAEEINIDLDAIETAAVNANDLDGVKALGEKLDELFEAVKIARPDQYVLNPSANLFLNMYEGVYANTYIKKDGSSTKIVNLCDTEEWNYSIEKIHEWYKKGYIRSDISSKGTALTSNEEYQSYSVLIDSWKPGAEVGDIERFGEEQEVVLMTYPYTSKAAPLMTMTSVGANTKHPKEAVEFIKLMNGNKELYNIICWGIEGKHYTKNEAGKVTEIPDSGYNKMGSNAWKFGNQFNALLQETQPDGVWEETMRMNDESVKSPMLGFVVDTSNIETEAANISNVVAEYKARIDFGTEEPNVWKEEYFNKLRQAGIDKIVNELQKQYDEYLKTKN